MDFVCYLSLLLQNLEESDIKDAILNFFKWSVEETIWPSQNASGQGKFFSCWKGDKAILGLQVVAPPSRVQGGQPLDCVWRGGGGKNF